MRSPPDSIPGARWSACGASAATGNDWRAWRNGPAPAASGLFPQEIAVEIKALACELPASRGLPLSRLSVADVARQAERCGLVAAGFATVPYDHLRAIFLSRLLKW